MNLWTGIGRLTQDPEMRATQSGKSVCTFTMAINRPGKDKGADYIKITAWDKQAENCERYLAKGRLVGVQGKIQTGSYEKDGKKVYTQDVIAERIDFLEWGEKKQEPKEEQVDFAMLDEAVPF